MDNVTKRKSKLAAAFALCPAAHAVALISGALIAAQFILRRDHALMARWSEGCIRPLHASLAGALSAFNFSMAEVLIALAALAVVARIAVGLLRLLRGRGSWRGAYRLFMQLAALALFVYAGFSVLWGVYYYGDDFAEKSGLEAAPISVQELERVTRYFAGLANEYGALVPRDERGLYVADREDILNKSVELFDATLDEFPCLAGPRVAAKPVYFSRVLSYLDFTGFFFPFTGEANVNTDFPPGLFASTVAHELSHQRGVAKEQEANFAAVLTCLNYGDADYCYSAALLAYTHLGNALYSADYEAWEGIYASLDENIKKDFANDRAYWRQFETPVQSVSNSVYEGFLYSYEQTLGLKSYGACVDLLVDYYITRCE